MATDPGQGTQVIWLNWDDYLAWLSGELTQARNAFGEMVKLGPPWHPGEHTAMIGPTGEGKTTHAVGTLTLRKYVLALDPKGEDETLSASGFTRVRSLPPAGFVPKLLYRLKQRDDYEAWEKIWQDIDDGLPARVIVGGGASTDEED